ncbi:hypothetical protein AB0K52_23990 [Glycomyces sp. NPDC049804]|uniref:hypothetical protein n=1 Tax=Glycomyces sp. NPDC049804 TaxID=3154363 RepID=UPI003413EE78
MTWLQSLWKATLIVVAVGVALMHSTGHACSDDVCSPEASPVAAAFDSHADMVGDADSGHHGHPMGTGMNPLQVCMAILTGLALAVSLWAIWRLARLVAATRPATPLRRAGWGAPASPPSGGRLSHLELSVFRI